MQKLIGKSDKIKKLLEFIDLIKDRNTTVLITGELGTGKELVAQRIHRTGSRRDAQLCIVDSGCITETIAGSELFGHREGSFTGATKDHKGKFESAQDGTIVLDEIGNMDYRTQAMLLRVLENRTFQKVGSSKTTQTNARVVAVTNKDLHKMVDDGTFRGDLLSRLFVFHIEVPPLRERKEDIPELSMYFLKYFCDLFEVKEKKIDDNIMELLRGYDWPGNIRELRNNIERAVLLSNGSGILPEYFPFCCDDENKKLLSAEDMITDVSIMDEEDLPSAEEIKLSYIKKVLDENKWNFSKVALLLKVSRNFLHNNFDKKERKRKLIKKERLKTDCT